MTGAKDASKADRGSGPVLMLRADANVAIATGHVMRCLALAQAWQDIGGQTIFVMAESTSAIAERLRSEKAEIVSISAEPGSAADGECTANLACARSADWLVVDGYHFGGDYQELVKNAGVRLLFLDDYGHAERYVADAVLNQNAHASETMYRNRSPHTRLLLGSQYVLLRREFRAWQSWQRSFPAAAKNVLLTLGGSDAENTTSLVLQALTEVGLQTLDVVVVGGASNPHLSSLQQAVDKAGPNLRLVRSASNMPELMAWADVAIAGAGATCWEMCLLGLPAILIDLAPNQLPIAKEIHRLGAGLHVGSAAGISPRTISEAVRELLQSYEMRRRMSEAGRKLVDGAGAMRVVNAIREPISSVRGG